MLLSLWTNTEVNDLNVATRLYPLYINENEDMGERNG